MEPETDAAAKGKDSDDDQNAPDSSSLTGKKADQDQQILMDTGDTNWYKNTQALKYLQPVFMPIVKDKMKSLQLQSMTDFGRQLCAEATADDIILVNGSLAQFKHLCPGTLVACQNLLNIIKGHTSDSVNFYQMLKGTDPQQWLKSPFEFVRLFLKDWMRCDIHDFQECDITALCTIVKRCKPLMQIFDERKIDDLRKVRNRTMHPATMSISQQEMENNIDVIIDFLEHIKSIKSTDEVTEAIESIKQLRTGDVRLLHSMVVRLIQGWLPGARIAYEHKSEQAKNQLQDIKYMETILARLSSGQEITSIKQSAEHEFRTKKEEKRELEKQIEELRKLRKEEKREFEKHYEELSKRLKEDTREFEKQIEELRKLRQIKAEEQREFEEQTMKRLKEEKQELRNHIEELRILRQIKAEEQREFEEQTMKRLEPPKRTTSGGQRFLMQEFSASAGPGGEREPVMEDFSKPEPLYDFPRMTLSALEQLDLGPSPATVCNDVSTIPVKSDKDKGPCKITGMVAISRTQLMLADESNTCIKLLDLERGTVIGVKVLPSAPHDVTCVPGSRVALTIPTLHQIHVFTADQNLKLCCIMGIYGLCFGIHCSGDRFFVICRYPPLVQILNMNGDIINTIQLDLDSYPTHLTCSPDNKFIYVSDFYNDTVTCMDMAGSVQWRYKCWHYTSAGQALEPGVCTGDGCIYICGFNMIHVVSPSGNKLAVIPFSLKGVTGAAVCYNSQERTLYVSRISYAEEENNYIRRISMH